MLLILVFALRLITFKLQNNINNKQAFADANNLKPYLLYNNLLFTNDMTKSIWMNNQLEFYIKADDFNAFKECFNNYDKGNAFNYVLKESALIKAAKEFTINTNVKSFILDKANKLLKQNGNSFEDKQNQLYAYSLYYNYYSRTNNKAESEIYLQRAVNILKAEDPSQKSIDAMLNFIGFS